jgi:hypothetical protein
VEAAAALRAAGQKNGGLYTPPELIMPTLKLIAKKIIASYRRTWLK